MFCSDAVFVRRAYLDVIGTLPTADEARDFMRDANPGKRVDLIDRLLARPEFADYWAMKWSDLLRVKAEFPVNLWPNAAQAYHNWIRTSVRDNLPYDRFAREMLRLLDTRGADFSGVLTQTEDWDTPVYIKPIRDGHEEQRLDFGNFNRLHDDVGGALLDRLERALPELDAVIVNQQLRGGVHSPFVQGRLNGLFQAHPDKVFVVDARHLSAVYDACLLKVNDLEATALCGGAHPPGDVIVLEEARAAARQLFARRRKPVFVTRGARGCLVADDAGLHVVTGLHIVKPTDPVGAGDSMVAAITAALAARRSPLQAATFGNFVAGVTAQKIFQTGTATPAEILAIGSD